MNYKKIESQLHDKEKTADRETPPVFQLFLSAVASRIFRERVKWFDSSNCLPSHLTSSDL